MKKSNLFIAASILGMMSLGTCAPAFANQTISGMDGETTGEIRTLGELGREDSTDPGSEIPDGDDRWINVTLPTEVVFYNTDGSEEIKSSSNYEISNNSGRPVKVDLTSYRVANTNQNERQSIKELNLANASGVSFNPVQLIENGTEKVTTSQELVRLANSEGKIGTTTDPSAKLTRFRFTGLVDADKLTADETTNIDSALNLKFTSLNMAGQEVSN